MSAPADAAAPLGHGAEGPARLAKPIKARSSDRAFLPAALEILETPPSPIKIALLILICAFVAVALIWSYLGRIDIIAVAQGKMQPTGRVKVIQPLETSRVVLTRVENGEAVKAGQVLVELDPSDASADVAGLAANYASYQAEVMRRQAAIEEVEANAAKPFATKPITEKAFAAKPGAMRPGPNKPVAAKLSTKPDEPPPTQAWLVRASQELAASMKPTLAVAWPATIPIGIRQREERVYTADLLQLKAQVASLAAQAEQKQAEQDRLTTMIAAEGELIGTLQERVTMRSTLVERSAGSRSDLIDATETLQDQKTTLAQQKGQLAEAVASMSVFAKDIQKATDTFIADNAQKLAEAERQAGDLTEKLAKARARLDHMILRSPIDGTVQASTLTTVGQVVTSGQDLMRIVPEGAALEIECYLPNKDIGFVKPGDHAIIKIESFPFTRYGTIDATVVRVARDAIPEPDAEQIEKGATRNAQAMSADGAQRTQNLVFPVTLRPTRAAIDVDGTIVPLGAGMAVTAEIRTGSRRILEYVFSPLVKVGSEAMKER